MPLLADFPAELEGDIIRVPAELAARIREAGALRVRIETAAPEPALLAARGIDAAMVESVAQVQKIGQDVAAFVLAGEGIAHGAPLAGRLEALLESTATAIRGADGGNSR